MVINISKRIGFGEGGGQLPKLEEVLQQIDAALTLGMSALDGDFVFRVTPATATADIADQNVGTEQVLELTIAGTVGAAGAGDIEVTVTAEGMENSPKTVAVTLANDDDAEDIATAIKAALDADADIGHGTTGFFTIARTGAVLTFTAKAEAANDDTIAVAVVADDATFAVELGAEVTDETPGVAPYRRSVLVELVNASGDVHNWFNAVVPVTIGDTAAGAAAVVGGLNPEMVNGAMTVEVELTGSWADTNTNTLTVSQATVLGYTVTAKTSVETSDDPV